jgi:peptide/nickel transport system permease protein
MVMYVAKRLLALIPIMLVISIMIFFFMTLTGDPARTLAGDNLTEAEIEILRKEMGLKDPFLIRYGRYMWDVLRGNLGKDLKGRDVAELYFGRLPYTILLAVAAEVITIVVSLVLGILASVKQNTWIDTTVSTVAIAGMSIPNFWIGLMMIILFSVKLGWLPTSGAKSFSSLIMPSVCMALTNAALATRTVRSSMLDEIRADYLRTARAKGVSKRKVIIKHALRNALIPIVTIYGQQFVAMLGGTVVLIEVVFSWPGIGNLIVTGVRSNEYTLVTSCIIVTCFIMGVVLIITDVLYGYIDPRVKESYLKNKEG